MTPRCLLIRLGVPLWCLMRMLGGCLAAERSVDDGEDLLVLADRGFAVIRLRITLDGTNRRAWLREHAVAFWQRADRNHDGLISREEYEQGAARTPMMGTAAQPVPELPQPEWDGESWTVDDLAAFWLRTRILPLQVSFSAPRQRRIDDSGQLLNRPMADARLFQLLDTDGNHKLTSRELEKAAAVLGPFDEDEDETISLAEILPPAPNPSAGMMLPAASRAGDGPLRDLSSVRIDAAFIRRILSLYDGTLPGTVKDLRLERHETGLSERLFSAADHDGDGTWDFEELGRFLERPIPALELSLTFGEGRPVIAATTVHDPGAIRQIGSSSTKLQCEIHGVQWMILYPASLPSHDRPLGLRVENPGRTLFDPLDVNGDGRLSLRELSTLNDWLAAWDADGDGKLVESEIPRNCRMTIVAGQPLGDASPDTEVGIAGAPQTALPLWFRRMDRNHDGEVSRREFLGTIVRFETIDLNQDGVIDAAEAITVK